MGKRFFISKPLQADKLSCIWFLKRFAASDTMIVPLGELSEAQGEGRFIGFPEAEIKRTTTNACFEALLQQANVEHPALLRMAEYIHDIEVNYWG